MCPAARYACFTAGHTGPALRDNSTAALTGRRTPRAFVPLRSTAGRRPLRTVLDGVLGVRRGGLTQAGRKRIPPRRRDFSSCRWQADDGVPGVRRGGLTQAGRKRIPPRRRDFSSCRWQADDGVSGIRRGGLTMAGRKRSRRQARLNIFSI